MKFKIGDRFNKWQILSVLPNNRWKQTMVKCRCDCGTVRGVLLKDLKSGRSSGCGCDRSKKMTEKFSTHKKSKSDIYHIWSAMRQRCQNKKDPGYKNYGGRGISVCKRWNKFESFFADMGDKPDGKSLDRINNNKGYSKQNCRWATISEQNNNRRDPKNSVMYCGENMRKASVRLSGKIGLVKARIKNGWNIKKAFTTKPYGKKI